MPLTRQSTQPGSKRCLVPECGNLAKWKGLCTTCYSEAKKLVETGQESWEHLASVGLAETNKSAFARALESKKADEDVELPPF